MQEKISRAVCDSLKVSQEKKQRKFAKRLSNTVTPCQISKLAGRPYLSQEDVKLLRMALGRLNRTDPSEALRLTTKYYDRIG